MFSTIVNSIARHTRHTRAMLSEIAEFRALKTEINKARCVLEFDGAGNITAANENALTALGFGINDLLNQHHRTLVGREEGATAEYQAFWRGLQSCQTQTGVFKLQNNKGESIFFQGYYAPVGDSKGALRKVVCYLTDITHDRNKTAHLEAEYAGIDSVFGLINLSVDTEILEVNDNYAKALGYTKEEMLGKKITAFMHQADIASKEHILRWQLLKNGEVQTPLVRRVAKDGSVVWLQMSYFPIRDSDGKVVKIEGFSTNVTQQQNKNADYQGKIDAISKVQAVIEFDLKTNVLNVNDNFLKAVGYASNDIVGQPHSMFVDSKTKDSAEYKAFWDKLRAGKSDANVYKRIGRGGKEVWLQASYNPIFDVEGNVIKVVKYATDITEYVEQDKIIKAKAKEAILIKNTLDSASTNMMVADNDGNIVYMNPATQNLMRSAASEFRKELPSFDPEKIIGSNFEMFNKNPSHQRNLLANLTQPYENVIPVASLFFKLKASPIVLEDGTRNGTSLEWIDVTAERRIQDEISNLVQGATEGDLTQRLALDDKKGADVMICNGINALMDKMSEIVAQVREAGETINTAAGEIASGNNDLSSRTEQQASSLEETASSMEELASTVKQNAENAKQANQLAAAASGVAVKGGQVVSEVVTTMADINDSSRKIEDIISVIDGIAFQTNILALNAAVEAARAGEQGRGFAVVAGEVRNLAQRSAAAAKEIKQLISDSVAKVQDGTKLVENAGNTMSEIVSSVQRVTDIMGEISAASIEQSAGIDQVNHAITSMDEVTQQNSALVEEAAAAAQSLVEQAVSLVDAVSVFKLNGEAARSPSVERRSPNSPLRGAASRPANKAAAAPKAKVTAKTGTDDVDSWEEF